MSPKRKKVVTKVKQVSQTYIIPEPDKNITDFKDPLLLSGLSADVIEFQDSSTGISYIQTLNFGLFRMAVVTQDVEVTKRQIGF